MSSRNYLADWYNEKGAPYGNGGDINLNVNRFRLRESIKSFAEYASQRIAKNPALLEAIGWQSKEARARRVVAALDANQEPEQDDVRKLTLELMKRNKGESLRRLAELQLAKADALGDAISIIDGTVSDMLGKVEAAPDQAALDAISDGLNALRQRVEAAETQDQLAVILAELAQR